MPSTHTTANSPSSGKRRGEVAWGDDMMRWDEA
jgi:hypothetical protein